MPYNKPEITEKWNRTACQFLFLKRPTQPQFSDVSNGCEIIIKIPYEPLTHVCTHTQHNIANSKKRKANPFTPPLTVYRCGYVYYIFFAMLVVVVGGVVVVVVVVLHIFSQSWFLISHFICIKKIYFPCVISNGTTAP